MSHKIRATVIAFVASFGVVGVAAQTIAQAEPNSSGPSQQETCDKLYGEFEKWVDIADGLYKQEGNGGTFKAALDTAESTLHAAENAGCDWASSARPPAKTLPAAPTTGTLQVSTSGGGTVTPGQRVTAPAPRLVVR